MKTINSNGRKVVAIIPARGGSKSIKSKNIKNFCGKPLIAWTIEKALKSKYIDKVIVSTDSHEIADTALKYGALVPFIRPDELAIDSIGVEPVLKHAYEWLRDNENYMCDAFVLLMPTTPTRRVEHIDSSIELFLNSNFDSVVTVNETPANHTPYWTLTKDKYNKVVLWGDIPIKNIHTRRQDFPKKCYARNDIAYVLKPDNLYESKPNLYGNNIELYSIEEPAKYEMDINTPDEWLVSEFKFKYLFPEDFS